MAFGDAVLVMSVHAAKFCLLFLLKAAAPKFFACKDTIVGMITLNVPIVLMGYQFKGMFSLDGLLTTG